MRTFLLSAILLLGTTGTSINERTDGRHDSVRNGSVLAAVPDAQGTRLPHSKLPLSFEANHGQAAQDVKFLSRGRGYGLFLTPTGATVSTRGAAPSTEPAAAMHMHFVGSNPAVRVVGKGPLPGVSNYFIGRDPAKWRTRVPHYAQVRYEEIYPGINVVFYGNDEGRLESARRRPSSASTSPVWSGRHSSTSPSRITIRMETAMGPI